MVSIPEWIALQILFWLSLFGVLGGLVVILLGVIFLVISSYKRPAAVASVIGLFVSLASFVACLFAWPFWAALN